VPQFHSFPLTGGGAAAYPPGGETLWLPTQSASTNSATPANENDPSPREEAQTERHSPDQSEPALVECPRCGALTDPEIDCRETLACPGDPDQQLFAPWMRDGKVYNLKNPFDRDSIRGPLEEQIRKTADYRALVCRLSRLGRLSNADAISAETEATWDRLMIVHDRLNELDEQ
jgi:hypothetical protein